MEWPIDTSAFSFMGSLPPEPLLDPKTKHQKTGVNGQPLYSIELMCFWEEGAELVTVSFPGAPPVGLKPGMPVKVRPPKLSRWAWPATRGVWHELRAGETQPRLLSALGGLVGPGIRLTIGGLIGGLH